MVALFTEAWIEIYGHLNYKLDLRWSPFHKGLIECCSITKDLSLNCRLFTRAWIDICVLCVVTGVTGRPLQEGVDGNLNCFYMLYNEGSPSSPRGGLKSL